MQKAALAVIYSQLASYYTVDVFFEDNDLHATRCELNPSPNSFEEAVNDAVKYITNTIHHPVTVLGTDHVSPRIKAVSLWIDYDK